MLTGRISAVRCLTPVAMGGRPCPPSRPRGRGPPVGARHLPHPEQGQPTLLPVASARSHGRWMQRCPDPQAFLPQHGLRSPLPTATQGASPRGHARDPGSLRPQLPRHHMCRQAHAARGRNHPTGLATPRPDPENGGLLRHPGPGAGRAVSGGMGGRPWALTVHAGRPGSRGARDLPLSAGTASRLPGDRPPGLAAVPVQGHNLTGAGGQLTCKRGTGVG